LVETNGQPNSSEGYSPKIRSNDYSVWANDLLNKLNINSCFIAGSSFGGLVCAKLCITNPEKVNAAFLLNPGCLQWFSLKWKNVFYNLLPIINPSEKNVLKFLDNCVFHKPQHYLNNDEEKLMLEYQLIALKQYRDRTQKPYPMNSALTNIKTPVHLFLGKNDVLFPYT